MQTINYFFGMLLMNKMVIVVIIIKLRLKHLINQVEGIDRFQKRIVFSPVQLLYICLGSIEENSLLKLRRPNHLHLNDKLTPLGILASHIHDTVFSCGSLGNHLRRKIGHRSDFFFLTLKRKKGVKQTFHQLRVLTKHFFEGQIGLRIQIFHKPFYFSANIRQISETCKHFNGFFGSSCKFTSIICKHGAYSEKNKRATICHSENDFSTLRSFLRL